MHHNEKLWQDYLGISILDLAELHCFHNCNEDTYGNIFLAMPGSNPVSLPLKSPGQKLIRVFGNCNIQVTNYFLFSEI